MTGPQYRDASPWDVLTQARPPVPSPLTRDTILAALRSLGTSTHRQVADKLGASYIRTSRMMRKMSTEGMLGHRQIPTPLKTGGTPICEYWIKEKL